MKHNNKYKKLSIFIAISISLNLVGCSSSEYTSTRKNISEQLASVLITESMIICFPDKNMEETVREKIQCPTGEILRSDVDKITDFASIKGKDIKNLSGIENFTSLNDLNLNHNDIKDIKPLEGLTNLTELSLVGTSIDNVQPLSGLINLTSLDLGANKISNIEPLKGLVNLTSLNLATNLIADIESLKGLVNLTNLDLAANEIEDYSPVYSYFNNLDSTDIAFADVIPDNTITSVINSGSLSMATTSNEEPNQINNQIVSDAGLVENSSVLSSQETSVIVPTIISTSNPVIMPGESLLAVIAPANVTAPIINIDDTPVVATPETTPSIVTPMDSPTVGNNSNVVPVDKSQTVTVTAPTNKSTDVNNLPISKNKTNVGDEGLQLVKSSHNYSKVKRINNKRKNNNHKYKYKANNRKNKNNMTVITYKSSKNN